MKKSLTILLILFFNLIFANNFNMENFLPYKNEYKKITDDAFFKANSLHQNICQKNNSIDITDFADIKITSAVSDVVVCFSSPNINSLNISSAGSVQNVELNTHAPNGRVSSAPYLIKGTVAYVNGSIGSELSMAVGVPTDNCAAIGVIPLPDITGNAYIMTTCVYPSGVNIRQSYMSAYLEGVSHSSFGSIYSN